MINNVAAAAAATLLIVAAPACNRAGGTAAEPFQGILELDEQSLGFELGGRLKSVAVKRGDAVTPGQALAELDDGLERPARDARLQDLRAAEATAHLVKAGVRREEIRTTEAQLVAAKETEENVRRTLARQAALEKSGASTVAVSQDVQAQLARALAERQALEERLAIQRAGSRSEETSAALARALSAQAALDQAEARLQRYVLRAPIAGRVTDVYLDPGEVAGVGAPVIAVADTHRPYVDVFVPQARIAGVRLQGHAQVRVDGETAAYSGVVDDIARKTEFTPKFLFSERERPNLVVRVRVRIDDPSERLHGGVPAFVTMDGSP